MNFLNNPKNKADHHSEVNSLKTCPQEAKFLKTTFYSLFKFGLLWKKQKFLYMTKSN